MLCVFCFLTLYEIHYLKTTNIKFNKENNTYTEIGRILGILRYAARNLIAYKCKANKMNRRAKKKISKGYLLSMRKDIWKLQQNEKKVNSENLMEILD